MICRDCTDAADGLDYGPVMVCSACGQGPVCVYRTGIPLADQKVVRHKRSAAMMDIAGGVVLRRYITRVWCEGSSKPPRVATGHDACIARGGCTCKHLPRADSPGDKP